MATAAAAARPKETIFSWEGKDKAGKVLRGEMRAGGQALVNATLRRQGILVTKVKKQRIGRRGKVTEKDISLFTRQLATMMKAGVPLLQSFEIVSKGASNPAVAKLLNEIKLEVETGSPLATAFRKYPLHFDALYCNLVGAGEQAGILETLLDRLAVYKEKILAIKSKIKAALFYPVAIIAVAFIIVAVIMIFVIPAFKQVFTSFGADLPAPTLMVMAISDWFVAYWYIIFPAIGGGIYGFLESWKRSLAVQIFMDRLMLKLPLFGDLVKKSSIARWTRTLSTMFAAGVPLVEALDSVGGASGNYVYAVATKQIQQEVSTGTSLTVAMQNAGVFPSMVIQMCSIGEETGALDAMLGKVADFYEQEVDDAVAALSSLMEPMIMVVLGTLIGGMVIAMYLPIFKLGQAV
ncbi:MAG: type II secretion system F family protein [Burkholderiales bacterium]